MTDRSLLSFPNPVNEYAARLVAAGVVLLTTLYLATGWLPVLLALSYGFLARVATGPRLSPLGQVVTRILAPRLERLLGRPGPSVAGPPKRFAQAIGATLSTAALVAHLAGAPTLAAVLVAAILVAATLESVIGYCLGCAVFGVAMRVGVIPERICLECADVTDRLRAAQVGGVSGG